MTVTAAIDAGAFKAQTRDQWNRAASGWDRHTPEIRQWLSSATDAMLETADIRTGQRVLDVAAGAGDQTLDIAAKVGPKGRVVATDIADDILALAARNAAHAGFANVQVHAADAEDLMLEEASFDAAVCRLGLMFLTDPLAGLSEIRRVLKPDGKFCSLVFAGPEGNPCIRILMSTAMRHAGLAPADPFRPGGLLSLGKPGALDDYFRQVGFRNVVTTPMDAPFRLPGTRDYLDFVRDSAGPILQILTPLDHRAQADAWTDIEAQLDAFQTDDGWVGPNALLLTAGQR